MILVTIVLLVFDIVFEVLLSFDVDETLSDDFVAMSFFVLIGDNFLLPLLFVLSGNFTAVPLTLAIFEFLIHN